MKRLIKKINIVKDEVIKEFNDKMSLIQNDLNFNHQTLNLPKEELDALRELRTKSLKLVFELSNGHKTKK